MTKEEFKFKSSDGTSNIHVVKWIPEGTPVAIFQICHGMSEFIERYEELASYMAERGYLVVGHDQLGHGKTVASPEDYGYFAKSGGSGKLVSDIFRLKGIITRDFPGIPYILMGHSFGSLLVREYIIRFRDGLDGVILMGNMNRMTVEAVFGKVLCEMSALTKKEKKRYRSQKIFDLVNGVFDKPFEKDGEVSNQWISSVKEEVELYNSYEETQFMFTVGAYEDLFDGIIEVNKSANIERIKKEMPILMLSGEDDPVGGMGKGVRALYKKYKNHDLNVKLKLYQGARHEIIHDYCKQEVFKDIFKWTSKIVNQNL